MTNLPAQHPSLSLHLADLALTPLVTSSASPAHLDSLSDLALAALGARQAARRANLGRPQRVMVEYPDRGALVLHSYLDPREGNSRATPAAAGASPRRDTSPATAADDDSDAAPYAEAAAPCPGAGPAAAGESPARPAEDDDEDNDGGSTPMLVGIVVAGSADDAREARRAAASLERVGRQFQKGWAAHAGEQGAGEVAE